MTPDIIAAILLAIIAASAILRARRAEARADNAEAFLASMTADAEMSRYHLKIARNRYEDAETTLASFEATILDCQTEARKSVLAKHVARFLNRKANPAPVDWEQSDPKIAAVLADLRARSRRDGDA